MAITIYGKPIAKARPRFARRGKFVMAYNGQETEEGRFLFEAKTQVKQCLKNSVEINCFFYMPRPKNHYGTGKKNEILKETAPIYHTKKPDLDNLVKFVLDCLNGLAWYDDSQIITLIAHKVYSNVPRTCIEIGAVA